MLAGEGCEPLGPASRVSLKLCGQDANGVPAPTSKQVVEIDGFLNPVRPRPVICDYNRDASILAKKSEVGRIGQIINERILDLRFRLSLLQGLPQPLLRLRFEPQIIDLMGLEQTIEGGVDERDATESAGRDSARQGLERSEFNAVVTIRRVGVIRLARNQLAARSDMITAHRGVVSNSPAFRGTKRACLVEGDVICSQLPGGRRERDAIPVLVACAHKVIRVRQDGDEHRRVVGEQRVIAGGVGCIGHRQGSTLARAAVCCRG